jgi:hypothetical protein
MSNETRVLAIEDEPDAEAPMPPVETVRGIGYRFRDRSEDS